MRPLPLLMSHAMRLSAHARRVDCATMRRARLRALERLVYGLVVAGGLMLLVAAAWLVGGGR